MENKNTLDIDLNPDITVGQLYFSGNTYSTSRLSGIMRDIIDNIPHISGDTMNQQPTQNQLTEIVKTIWKALGGQVEGEE